MCRAKTPKYDDPPEYQQTRGMKEGALYQEAVIRARGGRDSRPTLLAGARRIKSMQRTLASSGSAQSGILG